MSRKESKEKEEIKHRKKIVIPDSEKSDKSDDV